MMMILSAMVLVQLAGEFSNQGIKRLIDLKRYYSYDSSRQESFRILVIVRHSIHKNQHESNPYARRSEYLIISLNIILPRTEKPDPWIMALWDPRLLLGINSSPSSDLNLNISETRRSPCSWRRFYFWLPRVNQRQPMPMAPIASKRLKRQCHFRPSHAALSEFVANLGWIGTRAAGETAVSDEITRTTKKIGCILRICGRVS